MTQYGVCPACNKEFQVGEKLVHRVTKVHRGKFIQDFNVETVHLECPKA